MTMFLKGALYLGFKDWPRGWRYFHARHRPGETHHESILGLSSILGRRVVIYQEAGLGDTLQFMRWAPLVRQYAAGLTVFVRQPLYRLLTYMDIPQGFEIVNWSLQGGTPNGACLLGVMDAPLLFGSNINQIPSHRYLRPLPKVERRWPPPSVGIVWAGSNNDPWSHWKHTIERRRSIGFTLISQLMDCFREVSFVSLQKPDHWVENPDLSQPISGDADLLDTATIIDQLDLVITTDTAVAHLAGTLGRPVWLLLCRGACWRWFYDDSTTTPWYPSMRIYRQPTPGDWRSVIALIKRDLAERRWPCAFHSDG